MVDEGWGRRAAEFATLTEPATCREYVVVHHRLGIGEGARLLDVACGSGLDASPRLVTVARDRNPDSDIEIGDMQDLPWEDDSFDAVTSFPGDVGDDSHRDRRSPPRPPKGDGRSQWIGQL